MRKFYLFLVISFIVVPIKAQVSIIATAGNSGPVIYPTLSAAFTAINGGIHRGSIIISITASFTDVSSAVLNSSGAGAASYSAVIIRPTADNITIAFAASAGRGVVEFNGADNITVDGDNPNTTGINRDLTIINKASNTTAYTSVIRAAVSGANNVLSCDSLNILNCNLVGSGTSRNSAGITTEITTWGLIVAGGATGPTSTPAALTSTLSTTLTGISIANLQVNNNTILTVARGISINGSLETSVSGLVISGNNIGNPIAGAVDQVWSAGIAVSGSNNAVISRNTLYVESYIAGTANKALDFGTISPDNGNGAIIENNIVARVLNNNPKGWTACGINIGSGNNHTIRNNFVYNILNNQTAGSGSFGPNSSVYGIRIAGGTGHSILNNSVHLFGTIPGAVNTNLTTAFAITSTSQTGLRVVNNIFSNIVTGGNPTGTRNVAIYLPASGIALMNLDLNNNAYFGSTDPNSRLAQVGGTFGTGEYRYAVFDPSATTPASNFRSYTSTLGSSGLNDNASFGSVNIVPFASSTDLHIPDGTATLLESKGAISTAVTDIDGQTRNSATPDIGADEFNGSYVDAIPPIVSYTLLTGTTCTTAGRTFAVHISDPNSGINTASGSRPRIWFRKLSNANVLPATNDNTTNGWKFTESPSPNDTFRLTIDPSLIFGGLLGGDVVQYFITAQDQAAIPNVAVSGAVPSGNITSVALSAINFPVTGTINSFNILPGGLSGTVTIGLNGKYTSLTGQGGLFETINAKGLSGDLTANLVDATVNETGLTELKQMANGCEAAYILTIQPAKATITTIAGAYPNGALLRILSNNVIIDGSNNGGESRDLTVTNTSTLSPTVILMGSTGSIPIINSVIKNCNIVNGDNGSTAVMISDGNEISTPGYFSNISLQNNSIQNAYTGCYAIAVPETGNGKGLVFTKNDLSTNGANSVRHCGVYIQGVDGALVTNNSIGNFNNTQDFVNTVGIWIATGCINSKVQDNSIQHIYNSNFALSVGIAISPNVVNANISITDNVIKDILTSAGNFSSGIYVYTATAGVNIRRNKINNIKSTVNGANGIALSSTLAYANTNVNNNFISDIAAPGANALTVSSNGYGIIVNAGGGYNIDHNTVLMNTNQAVVSGLPAAINIATGVAIGSGSINMRNNIFTNTQTLGINRYAIIVNVDRSALAMVNNNAYSTLGPNLGRYIAANFASLAALQSNLGGNGASVIYQPSFVTNTDLHLQNSPGANWCLDGKGLNLFSNISTDIDGETRSIIPDIGADEFLATGFVVTNPPVFCAGDTVDLTAPAITSGSMAGLTFSYYTDVAATKPLNNPNAINTPGTYYIKATGASCPLVRPVIVTLGITPVIQNQPTSITTCSGQQVTFTITASNTLSYQWQSWNGISWNNISGANGSSYNQINPSANITGTQYRVILSNVCTAVSDPAILTVNKLPQVNIQASPYSVLLPGQFTTIFSSVSPTGGNYSWYRDNSLLISGVPQLPGLTVNDQGTYQLKYTDLNGCINTSNDIVVSPGISDHVYVYPNPSKGRFFVSFFNMPNELVVINMYDEKGSRVYTTRQSLAAAYSTLTVGSDGRFANGTYIVEIIGNSQVLVATKLLIVR